MIFHHPHHHQWRHNVSELKKLILFYFYSVLIHSESDQQIKTGFGREIRDGRTILQPMLRVRRSKFNTLYNGNERYGKLQEETTTEDSRENSHEKSKEQSNETNEDVSEICIVKCVFQNFGMV